MEPVEIVKIAMQWLVVPVAGFVWLIFRTQQIHATEIAVLKVMHSANKEAHDREFREVRESFKGIFAKLDNIEQALRK